MARDRNFTPPLAKQILIYAKLDNCTTVPDPYIVPFALHTYEENSADWKALLGDCVGGTRRLRVRSSGEGQRFEWHA